MTYQKYWIKVGGLEYDKFDKSEAVIMKNRKTNT